MENKEFKSNIINKQKSISRKGELNIDLAEKPMQKIASAPEPAVDLNSMFAGEAMNGMIDEGEHRATMPDYISRLAEIESQIEMPAAVEIVDIDFADKESSMTRSNVSDDDSRVLENKKEKTSGKDPAIEKMIERMLVDGKNVKDINKVLQRKFPEDKLNKYFATARNDFNSKLGQLGFIYLDKDSYDTCDEIREHLSELRASGRASLNYLKVSNVTATGGKKKACSDCTKCKQGFCLLTNLKIAVDPKVSTKREAKLVMSRFAGYINQDIIDSYTNQLVAAEPAKVLASFIEQISALRKTSTKTADSKTISSFKRDMDKQELKERIVENNKVAASVKEKYDLERVYLSYKDAIQSGKTKKEAHKVILASNNPILVEKFYNKYEGEIKRLIAFVNRGREDDSPVTKIANTGYFGEARGNDTKKEQIQGIRKQASKKIEDERLKKIAKTDSIDNVYDTFREAVQSGKSKEEAHKVILNNHEAKLVEGFYNKFANQIERLIRFANRSTGYENSVNKIANNGTVRENPSEEIKGISHSEALKMNNIMMASLTAGRTLVEASTDLKKAFGYKQASMFLRVAEERLAKHYGQVGYLFIDSNIYPSCEDMKKAFATIPESRKATIYAVKANSNCSKCSLNCKGKCSKVALHISNSPLVRSSRAAKKVMERVAHLVPKQYVDEHVAKITEDNNSELVSKFILGMASAEKNIKMASKNKAIDMVMGFTEDVSLAGADIFDRKSTSKIADSTK